MTNHDDDNNQKSDMRGMLILSAAIVFLIVGGMGLNVLFHKDTATGPTDMSSQSRTAPAQ
jgi:hypothetical protein